VNSHPVGAAIRCIVAPIHDVVPWPDAKLHGPTMRKYAIPEQATEWQTAPERKRAIKTHLNWELLPYSEEERYISVILDPKDVFISAYCFIRDAGMGAARRLGLAFPYQEFYDLAISSAASAEAARG
jgi:hypothetical protein